MYNLKLPENNNNEIDLSEVVKDNFKGIVLGYKNKTPTCFILKYDAGWYSYMYIDTSTWYKERNDILILLKSLIEDEVCDCFKVIKLNDFR